MRALRSLLAGVGTALTSPLLVALLWLANVAVALVLAGVMFSALSGSSLGYLAERAEVFDWVWWVDFERNHPVFLASLTHLSGWLVLLGLVLNTFLIAGALEILDRPGHKFTFEAFFHGAGRRFSDFLGLLVLELLLLWGLDIAWNDLLGGWLEETVVEGFTDERHALWFALAEGAAFVLLFYVVRTAFDFARVRTVVEGRSSFVLAALAGWAFFLRHLWSAAVLTLGVAGLHALVIVGALWGERFVEGRDMLMLGALFLLHQAYVLLRIGARVADYSAKIELFRRTRRAREEARSRTPVPSALVLGAGGGEDEDDEAEESSS